MKNQFKNLILEWAGLFQRNNYYLALEEIKTALENNPSNPVVNFFYGITLIKIGKYIEAEKIFENLIPSLNSMPTPLKQPEKQLLLKVHQKSNEILSKLKKKDYSFPIKNPLEWINIDVKSEDTVSTEDKLLSTMQIEMSKPQVSTTAIPPPITSISSKEVKKDFEKYVEDKLEEKTHPWHSETAKILATMQSGADEKQLAESEIDTNKSKDFFRRNLQLEDIKTNAKKELMSLFYPGEIISFIIVFLGLLFNNNLLCIIGVILGASILSIRKKVAKKEVSAHQKDYLAIISIVIGIFKIFFLHK